MMDNSWNHCDNRTDSHMAEVLKVVNWVTFSIGLPVVCLAIYVLYRQVRANQAAHVYVINLLISDIVHFTGRPWFFSSLGGKVFFYVTFSWSTVLSVGFMVCIAMERYLMIAHPHWYSIRCTVRNSILTSIGVWLLSLIVFVLIYFIYTLQTMCFIVPVLLLLPFPLLIYLFVATWKALCKAHLVSNGDKRRILTTLAIVIGNYTFLFLPYIIVHLAELSRESIFLWIGDMLMYFNPLLDPVLYIFMRKNTGFILEDFPCCRKSSSEVKNTSAISTHLSM